MIMRLRAILKRGWPPIAAVILLLVIWQLAVVMLRVEKWLLPGPLDIVKEGAASFSRLMMHTGATIQICLIGFAVGVSFGFAVALLMHLFKPLRLGLSAYIVMSQNIPTIVLAPLLVVWFGFGLLPKVIVIALVCFFPIAVSMLNGLGQTDRTMKNYMRMIGASRWQLLRKLELPHSLPSLFSGLRISATYSVMGAVISEWLGASRGLGYYMTLSSSAYRTDRVFAVIFIIIALSIVFYGLIGLLEKVFIRWKTSAGKEEEA